DESRWLIALLRTEERVMIQQPRGQLGEVSDSTNRESSDWREGADCWLQDVDAARLPRDWMVSAGTLGILALDLTFRAFVHGYNSPAWVPTLLSAGLAIGNLKAMVPRRPRKRF